MRALVLEVYFLQRSLTPVERETGELTTYQTLLYANIGASVCTEYFAAFERETAYHAYHLRTGHRRLVVHEFIWCVLIKLSRASLHFQSFIPLAFTLSLVECIH